MILQGAMWCKGYSPGGLTGTFGPGTEDGVKQMQSDAGLTPNGIVTPRIFQAMLNMDAYRLVNNGDENIRLIQRNLNGNYYNTTAIQPADGHYSRDTNTALIYGLQLEANVSGANGHFGLGTRAATPTIRIGDSRTNFVQLIQYCLYVNNYNPGNFGGRFDSTMENQVKEFQSFHKLPSDGVVNLNTWMSLLVSTGNPDVKGLGIDTSYTITPARAQTLVNDGRQIVGRYLTGSFALSSAELNTIYGSGLRVFPIYQRFADHAEWFSYNQGIIDARDAIQAATTLQFSYNTIIYFAIDFDVSLQQINNLIIPYFTGVHEEIDRYHAMGVSYRIGVYGPRYACTVLSERGLTTSSFVSGMSTSFFGNKGHVLPEDWAFNQVKEHSIGSGAGLLDIDNLIVSGRDQGVSSKDNSVTTPNIGDYVSENAPFMNKLNELFNFAYERSDGDNRIASILTLNYLRSENYNSTVWIPIAGAIDSNFVEEAEQRFGKPSDFPILYDPITGTDMDFMHMSATLNAILFQKTFTIGDLASKLSDFAGWLGDLITVIDDAKRAFEQGRFNSLYDAAYYYIGHTSDSAGTFPLEDLLGDMDAINIGRALDLNDTNANVYEEMNTYYRLGFRRRFKQAAHNRFEYNREEIYNEAYQLLTTLNPLISTPRTLFRQAFNVDSFTNEEAENVAKHLETFVQSG
ncbi:glycoside hydrolase domain-containing protein [Shouchella miscanthi]|uniref:glycoside hydrolase domain-containing protein n=1 Tax=Shouchella miscanthi TaxID=2598861 RepID=UPI00119D918B|nr:glycoside hydrolase domain-containing protein [Shouchella miscanthi]